MINKQKHSSSFRDPSGYIFVDNGVVKRRIEPIYFDQYKALKKRGLYKKLFSAGLLVEHNELHSTSTEIIIQPEQIPFITYPYEWSLNQYKEAALLTLRIQKFCLDNDMSLKDASAFNVTFHNGKATFIDTLSFDFYHENEPWRAFKQFVSHFLGPLLLAKYHGAPMLQLMSAFIDGIPVKVLASMLPSKTKINPFIYSNVHLLAKYENNFKDDYQGKTKTSSLSKKSQLNIIKSLYNFIKKIDLKESSEWGDYYSKVNYTESAFIQKSKIINSWVESLNVKTLIDIGGNDGTFVRQISSDLDQVLVCDIDNNAVNFNYNTLKANGETHITPFVLDVLSPSPAIGFNNKERQSFLERIKAFKPELTMALAVIHHMSLSGNIPFEMSAKFFASFSKYLIIEFPKRDDSWVKRLLNSKREFKEHFDFYNIKSFEEVYTGHFSIVEKVEINDSERVMYLLKVKNA
ncbi:class I SAM-dependent methyltransferase [Flavisericum labens]|uniref:class I SAM-dependent methyltransferase n=1 Tax=Flavisericum labens TaxID=3377112 RepID=UPI00387AAA1E